MNVLNKKKVWLIIGFLALLLLPLGIAFSQSDENPMVYLPVINTSSDDEPLPPAGDGDWSTLAGNVARTSWTDEEVTGNLNIEWYRPIEAYIPQNTQIIATQGLLYVSTARGLYALNAANGEVAWRFDTEMPLGHSPTVEEGVVYVGGYDGKLHALDAANGNHLWSFDNAGAGYSSNPLVVDDVVFAGNRDGYMYAIGAHGTSNQGQEIWKYKSGGVIHLSAAYADGKVIFVASDNRAYALNASSGSLAWKSDTMPGLQYQSYWPVIYRDKVIFSVAFGYRKGFAPGTRSILDENGNPYTYLPQIKDLWPEQEENSRLGPEVAPQSWAHGYPVIDAHRMTEYLEDNPQEDMYVHKPWRRMLVALDIDNGIEYSFDSDNDGYMEYIPAGYWGTGSGNRYPAIVGSDNLLYFSNVYQCCSDSKGRIMGWQMETPSLLSVTGGFAALAEPQAISAGGNTIYRSLCCDRVGDWFSTINPSQAGILWTYNDSLQANAPDYDPTWTIEPGYPRHHGWYDAGIGSVNAAYHNHGDQNPIVPYNGRLYIHRSNAIFAFGPGSETTQLPMLEINEVQDNIAPSSEAELRARLEHEIQKMVDAGHLRPGYYNVAGFQGRGLEDYFSNPGDTLYTLTWAYPYLSSQLQAEVRTYLQQEFNTYFDPEMFFHIGWADGAPREDMEYPPEVEADIPSYAPRYFVNGFAWMYPQYNFYGMWKYAEIFPDQAANVYSLAKSKLQVPVPDLPVSDYFLMQPYELNGWIAGYIGFLELQETAGMDTADSQLRTQVTNELNRLLELRVNTFTKDSYWGGDRYQKKHLDIATNFIFLVPELGEYMRQNILPEVQQAVEEYDAVAPYWFVSRYEATIGEGVMSHLYNYNALFAAKALIFNESRAELSKYLDAPAFARGDLLYIQNLIMAIEADQNSHLPDNRNRVEIVTDHRLTSILTP